MPRIRPESYGHKTVHTGNQPHKPSSQAQRYLAKRWGKIHGFAGAEGGWICRVEVENGKEVLGQHLAHGWGQFYHLMSGQIIAWASRIVGVEPFSMSAKDLAAQLKGRRIK